MQQSDDFLRSVEARLRCPADRRPAVIEELRGHLSDRTEALVQQGISAPDAERRAIREMGPAWVLALHLSAANGWSVLARVLRELWAAGVGFEVAVLCGLLAFSLPEFGRPPEAIPPSQWAYIVPAGAAVLAVLCAFGFAMGRVVRGWLWAIIPTLALLIMASRAYPRGDLSGRHAVGFVLCLSSGVLLLAVSVWGQRREVPKLAWLAWASAGAITAFVAALGVTVMLGWGETAAGVSTARLFLLVVRELANAYEIPTALTLMGVSWFFWLGAWAIERFGEVGRPDLSSTS